MRELLGPEKTDYWTLYYQARARWYNGEGQKYYHEAESWRKQAEHRSANIQMNYHSLGI